nr:FtsW/RodA/SpoVE family cell cycle protein [Acetatifactor sp.]
AIIILAITCIIIFIAHPKTWPFIIALAGVAVFAILIILIVKNRAAASESFRFRRIQVWLNPELYPREGGYQTLQALYALGSGGFFGKGLGNSTQKLGFVPEAENDMIFSIVCEELGVFGGIIVLFLFGYLLYRLFFIAQNAKDLYGSLMVSGIFAHIMLQVVLNICVVLNVIPTTGITLPFISYGGTSVLFLIVEMALALMVSRQIPVKRQERDLWGDIVSDYDY